MYYILNTDINEKYIYYILIMGVITDYTIAEWQFSFVYRIVGVSKLMIISSQFRK